MISYKKNIIFSLSALVVLVLIIEIFSRVAVFFYSHDFYSFQYGICSSINISFKNREISFAKTEWGDEEDINERKKKNKYLNPEITIATFGGSTTYGFNCDNTFSSWPEELERILNDDTSMKCQVLNFGESGANTDRMVELLPFVKLEKVGFALWANFINESDILSTGNMKNFDVLSENFSDVLENKVRPFRKNRYKILILRLDKTIKKYLLSYYLMNEIIVRLKHHFLPSLPTRTNWEIITGEGDKTIANKLISLAVTNYKLNFLEAKKYFDRNNIKMVLIRLPVCEAKFKHMFEENGDEIAFPFMTLFWESLDALLIELSNQYNIPLINVHEQYIKCDVADDVFCDSAHQSRKGHILTAKYISKDMKPILQ